MNNQRLLECYLNLGNEIRNSLINVPSSEGQGIFSPDSNDTVKMWESVRTAAVV